MIGYWHDTAVVTVVCLFVRLPVCLSVCLCIVVLRVGVGVESCTVYRCETFSVATNGEKLTAQKADFRSKL